MEFLLASRFMLLPIPTRWVCWATAASLLVCLVLPTHAKSATRERSGKERSGRGGARVATTGLSPRLLFVAGPTQVVRFRIDLDAGTLATPREPHLLDGIIDVALTERLVILCQASSVSGASPRIVAFDLHSGKRTEAALAEAYAASVSQRRGPARFCAGRQALTARPQNTWALSRSSYFADLQMSLERHATILPSVSNGEEQSSFLISSRHSFSSLTTTPPGQS